MLHGGTRSRELQCAALASLGLSWLVWWGRAPKARPLGHFRLSQPSQRLSPQVCRFGPQPFRLPTFRRETWLEVAEGGASAIPKPTLVAVRPTLDKQAFNRSK
jgi:hypothetical protein